MWLFPQGALRIILCECMSELPFFSSLNRVLEPYVTMEITLSTGEIKTFEVQFST